MQQNDTIHRTPVSACDACQRRRLHGEEDWKRHPYAGHGYLKEVGWSHPDLKTAAEMREDGK